MEILPFNGWLVNFKRLGRSNSINMSVVMTSGETGLISSL